MMLATILRETAGARCSTAAKYSNRSGQPWLQVARIVRIRAGGTAIGHHASSSHRGGQGSNPLSSSQLEGPARFVRQGLRRRVPHEVLLLASPPFAPKHPERPQPEACTQERNHDEYGGGQPLGVGLPVMVLIS